MSEEGWMIIEYTQNNKNCNQTFSVSLMQTFNMLIK